MNYHEFLAGLEGCPFCLPMTQKIIAENNTAYLTYSLAPYHHDHLLICPKRHSEHLLDLTEEEIRDIDLLQRQGLIALEALGYDDISILVRQGKKSGKTIYHTHYHLIPATLLHADMVSNKERPILSEEDQDAVVTKIRSLLE
jgi:diadenosine tetraphosphate (Ap4A) HIT family hydrolase